ncbi:MAG: HlyD family type I secretion periplasmic adaptor subunit [Alphaproteobacteria bacterium]|nr:HlyD family type I secretion periplasmic adaptor subunit [Alphaproteobacteria bacterium]
MDEIATSGSSGRPASLSFYRILGFGTVAAGLFGLAVWLAVAPIRAAIVAQGAVVVESERQLVQHRDGGVIKEILVTEGQLVDGGSVLFRIDPTVAAANLDVLDERLLELYATRARLMAEREGLDQMAEVVGLPALLSETGLQTLLAAQEALFEARRNRVVTQKELFQERIGQQQDRIEGLDVQIDSVAQQSRLIGEELQGVRTLFEQGFAPETRLRALERERERLRGQTGALRALKAETEGIISETRLELVRIDEGYRETAIDELAKSELIIRQLEAERPKLVDALDRTEVLAPVRGRVLGLSVHTLGAVVAAGEPLTEIVPEGDALRIVARVSPSDVDKVAIGQDALVRFTSLGVRSTPRLFGQVERVSADALTDATSGLRYFEVSVSIDLDADTFGEVASGVLSPGMPAETFIQTERTTALTYLLRPLTDSVFRTFRDG